MSTPATPPWTRYDLDGLGCQIDGCTTPHHHGPLFVGGHCHAKKPVDVEYRRGALLVISCHVCTLHVANIAVAPHAQVVLDAGLEMPCKDPTCDDHTQHVLVMRPPCHRMGGVYVTYTPGLLTIACGVCKDVINTLPVKERTADA